MLEKAAIASKIKEMSASRAAVLNISSMAGSIQRTGVDLTEDLVVPSYKISKVRVHLR